MTHDPKAYMCSCLQCWWNDVADQAARERRRENAIIAEATEIMKKQALAALKSSQGTKDSGTA